jgi:hypothetical protein
VCLISWTASEVSSRTCRVSGAVDRGRSGSIPPFDQAPDTLRDAAEAIRAARSRPGERSSRFITSTRRAVRPCAQALQRRRSPSRSYA